MKTRKWISAIRAAIPIGLIVLLGLPTILRPAEVRVARLTVEAGTTDLSGGALLMPDEAAAAALNRWETTADGYRLRHPRHTATFAPDGLHFMPRRGKLGWAWRLTFVGAGDAPLAGVATGRVPPTRLAQGVAYPRGGLVEQYQAQKNAIEQQFLIPRPLPLGGADLVIAGAVESAGAFEATATGWLWQAEQAGVRLGNVRVYDAQGVTLPVTMAVTANSTRIVVDGSALAQAAYPVTIDPEIGANDFRLSFMGGDGLFDAFQPAVACNSQANEYLVVWYGDDNTGSLVDSEYEIFGQRVDATTGQPIGSNFRISDMGGSGNAAYGAFAPAVAYNSTDNQYLVVWSGDDNTGSLVDEEFEIYGQRLSASGGGLGTNDFRISDMGPDGNPAYDAYTPAVVYNSTDNQYLVVWSGDDDINEEYEIYGQRLSATGGGLGTNDFRISDMGPDGNAAYGAFEPAVAYNSQNNEYLVVWSGDDNTGSLVDGEFEIFGQRLNATGGGLGTNDFRISVMGGTGNAAYDAFGPEVAYNSTDNEYLVVWDGNNSDAEFEIYGQLLSATGGGISFRRISDMGPDGNAAYGASGSAVAYNSQANEYLVTWWGDNDYFQVDDEYEIFGQRLDADGNEVGDNDLRISYVGAPYNINYSAYNPAMVYNSRANQYLVVWRGDDNTPPLEDNEYEIFGRRMGEPEEVRISHMGGDALFDAFRPAVAYNSTDNEYLVVWSGDDDAGSLVDEEFEIYGQRVNAATGELILGWFLISHMMDGNAAYDALDPAVAYNSQANQYLVVWSGDDDTGSLVDEEFEIFGQRLHADGDEMDYNFRISDMGPDGNASYDASDPAVAYNSQNNEYLVGDDNTGSLVNEEFEIFGQRLNASGTEVGANDFRISDMGGDGVTDYNAFLPALAYNSTDNQYLVVWQGDDSTTPLVNNEFEIFGQRLNASGTEVGTNDFRISDMGPNGNTAYGGYLPAVAYNSQANEYLVVWQGTDNTAPLVAGETEIFGQRLNATGTEVGTNDFRISDMGPNGNTAYGGYLPAVAYNSQSNQYLVVWYGDDNTGSLVDGEFEIFAQHLDASGAEVGDNDFRLSDMGPDGNTAYEATYPAVAYSSADKVYLLVWQGDDDTGPLVDEEFEIFGQLFVPSVRIYLPLVLNNAR
jgi:hypothetical protein